jgi:hypothetical protein
MPIDPDPSSEPATWLRAWHESAAGAGEPPAGGLAGLTAAALDEAGTAGVRAAVLQLDEGLPLPTVGEHDLLALVRAAVRSGRLRIDRAPPALLSLVSVVQAPAPAPAAPPPRAPVRARPPAPSPAVDATFADLDVGAMVAVMEQAARDGTPFCEECARAARERAAAENA